MNEHFGFFFERSGLSGYEGPNDPSGEHFTGRALETSLARETIQNALDAAATKDGVVRVEFELRRMATAGIPGFANLRQAMAAAVEASQDLQGREHLEKALAAAKEDTIAVLRVGDYGTTGLTGSESVKQPHTPLSTLSRGTGASSRDGGRGGSFGIGSSIGLVGSATRAVAYISLRDEEPETVYAATSRLASHYDSDGELRNATGHYTDLGFGTEFHYRRGVTELGPFPPRVERGTDVYLLGYLNAVNDPNLHDVRNAVLANFLVAITKGKLVVEGRSDGAHWILNAETIEDILHSEPELTNRVLPYYHALSTEPIQATLRSVGEVALFVDVSPEYERGLGTQLMRKPLMFVQLVRSGIPVPFAAVFICENDAGNSKLREIEPPTHDSWNENGPRSDAKAVREIRKFIRDTLRQVLPERSSESVDVVGLADYLPKGVEDAATEAEQRPLGDPGGNTGPDEAVELVGVERELPMKRTDLSGPVRITVEKDGVARPEGEFEAFGGRGKKKKKPEPSEPSPPSDPTRGDAEDFGRARIRAGDLAFRSYANRDGSTSIHLRALEDVAGDLALAAYGGGDREVFNAALATAKLTSTGEDLQVRDSLIEDLSLSKGDRLDIVVTFATATRYRLGVANG